MEVFCGPYRFFKKSTTAIGAFESVLSISVIKDNDDYNVEERFYKAGNLVNTEKSQKTNLTVVIHDLINRFKFLTAVEQGYSCVDVLDTFALQQMVEMTAVTSDQNERLPK